MSGSTSISGNLKRRRSHRRVRALLAVALLALLAPDPVGAETHSPRRLELAPETRSAPSAITGLVEIVAVHPFREGKLSFSSDGSLIGARSTPPYLFLVDFGPRAVERRLTFTANDRSGRKRKSWTVIINEGARPLEVSLSVSDKDPAVVRASVTSPADDPVERVTFLHGDEVIATLNTPPFEVRLPSGTGELLHAIARTRSGAEAGDQMAGGRRVEVANFVVRRVPLYVTVVDEAGAARAGLNRSDVVVTENGREARIVSFRRASEQPLSLALVLDTSASMGDRITDATTAAKQFLASVLKPRDRVAVFTIGTAARRIHPISSDHETAIRELSNAEAQGRTALYDGIDSAVREIAGETGQRAIVVFSDGADTTSMFSYDEIFERVRRAAVPIYFISYTQEEVDRATDEAGAIALETGGFVAIATQDDLDASFRRIEEDLRSQYLIEYEIADQVSSQSWRAVTVSVRSPRLTARTVRGFFVP